MKIVVVDETQLINRDLKKGDVCDVTEEMWHSWHPAALVTKPDGKEFWYQKSAFKLLTEIREEKLNELGI
jgi:hypothetical protein